MPISPERNNKLFKYNFLTTTNDYHPKESTKTKVTFNLDIVSVHGGGEEIEKEKILIVTSL